jgi:hypothetical protein
MVKFTRGSPYYDIVVSKLSSILSSTRVSELSVEDNSRKGEQTDFHAYKYSNISADLEPLDVSLSRTETYLQPLKSNMTGILKKNMRLAT